MTLGWIKLHRKFINWEWYQDLHTKSLFIHLLLMANHEDKSWQGKTIKTGQLITSLQHLCKETGISVQRIRTSIKKLKSTNEITDEPTNQYRLITVLKYSDYQNTNNECNTQINTLTNNQLTSEQQSTNNQLTTNKNNKNNKNDKNNNKEINKEKISEFVSLTLEEKNKLVNELGVTRYNKCIEILNNYKGSSGKKYKSDYHAIRNWVIDKSKSMNGNSRYTECEFSTPESTELVKDFLRNKGLTVL